MDPAQNRWVLSLANTWRPEGARLIAGGGISAGDLVAALDAIAGPEQRGQMTWAS